MGAVCALRVKEITGIDVCDVLFDHDGVGTLDFGWKADAVGNAIGPCPLKLCTSLDRLSCVIHDMLANQAKKRKLLPELDDMFESVQVVRSRYQIEPHGSEVCFFNLQAASKHGEISRSDASCSGPVLRPPPPGLRGSQLTFFVRVR